MPCFLALLLLMSAGAEAFRMVPGSFSATPSEVMVSQEITVQAAFDDDPTAGTELFSAEVTPEPLSLVAMDPSSEGVVGGYWSCSNTGRMDYKWVFKALAPGEVAFRIRASQLPCRGGAQMILETSGPVKINPIPISSEVSVFPRIVDTNGAVEVRLDLRNDSPIPVEYPLPEVKSGLGPGGSDRVVLEGKPEFEPLDAFKGGRMRMEPSQKVSGKWRFRAKGTGEFVFMVSAANLLFNTPSFKVRDPAVLSIDVPFPAGPSAVSREHRLRGRVRAEGGTGVESPGILLSWTPAGAARLVSEGAEPPKTLEAGGEAWEFVRIFELLSPGIVTFSVSAQGLEADTGDALASETLFRPLKVLPPPDLDLRIVLKSSTVFEGEKAGFRLKIANRGVGVANLSPVYEIREGMGLFGPSSPLFQSVPAESTAFFDGSVVPVKPGALEFAARVEARGQVEGARVSVASEPARLAVLPFPDFLVFGLTDRVRAGTTAQIRFLVKNAPGATAGIDSITANLSVPSGEGGGRINVPGAKMLIGPAKAATLTVEAYLPDGADPYPVTASLNISGKSVPCGLPFSLSLSARSISLACPWQTRFVLVEPPQVFLPPMDPLLYVEFSVTRSGDVVLAVLDSKEAVVRTILGPRRMEPGWYSELWRGDSADGKGPVKAGNYLLRLAGLGPGMAGGGKFNSGDRWAPGGFSWQVDYPLEVRRP